MTRTFYRFIRVEPTLIAGPRRSSSMMVLLALYILSFLSTVLASPVVPLILGKVLSSGAGENNDATNTSDDAESNVSNPDPTQTTSASTPTHHALSTTVAATHTHSWALVFLISGSIVGTFLCTCAFCIYHRSAANMRRQFIRFQNDWTTWQLRIDEDDSVDMDAGDAEEIGMITRNSKQLTRNDYQPI